MGQSKGKKLSPQEIILAKLDELSQQTAALEQRMNATIGGSVVKRLVDENAKLKQEIRYVSAQLESVCTTISRMVEKIPDQVAENQPYVEPSPLGDGSVIVHPVKLAAGDVDYDALGYSVAKRLYVPQAVAEEINYDELAKKVAEHLPPVEIDYDELGYSVAKRMYIPSAIAEEVDYDAIAAKVVEKVPAFAEATPEDDAPVQAEIDYDLLAAKVAESIPVQEPVSADYIAARVAEQIIIPSTMEASDVELDVEELSRKVADKIVLPAIEPGDLTVDEDKLADAVVERLKETEAVAAEATPATYEANIDEQSLAENIASRLNFSLSDELIAAAVVKNLAGAIDSDEIADCVAKKVGTISPEQFEITVDDDGCDSLARAVEEKLDYDALASSVAEKLNPAFMAAGGGEEIDAEELARAISEKLSVNANLDEDAIADKAATVLSNYMPEIDTDDIADKVIAGIIPALPSTAVIDSDVIAATVSDRIVETQEGGDYDIVIDEDGLSRITESISEEITRENDARYSKVDEDLENIKQEYGSRFDKLDTDVEEIKELLRQGVVITTEQTEEVSEENTENPQEEVLVTVSDIVGDEPQEDQTLDTEEEEDEVIGEIVEDIDENPSDGEIMPDGIPGISGGVDFVNMMKYNRSFIARIIQGTDEQKTYYGRVKTALLSYRKVNSNIAWGAERFNKGRETIARFKIRGKTLCLYLALDPNEYATSVYHQVDVSDNKSMHGTPMMVKIKSPLGVKKAIRLIDDMLAKRDGVKHNIPERDYAAMYPYETIEELIDDGLVKDVSNNK